MTIDSSTLSVTKSEVRSPERCDLGARARLAGNRNIKTKTLKDIAAHRSGSSHLIVGEERI